MVPVAVTSPWAVTVSRASTLLPPWYKPNCEHWRVAADHQHGLTGCGGGLGPQRQGAAPRGDRVGLDPGVTSSGAGRVGELAGSKRPTGRNRPGSPRAAAASGAGPALYVRYLLFVEEKFGAEAAVGQVEPLLRASRLAGGPAGAGGQRWCGRGGVETVQQDRVIRSRLRRGAVGVEEVRRAQQDRLPARRSRVRCRRSPRPGPSVTSTYLSGGIRSWTSWSARALRRYPSRAGSVRAGRLPRGRSRRRW